MMATPRFQRLMPYAVVALGCGAGDRVGERDITAPACFVDDGRERRRFLPNADFTLITFRVVGDCPTP